MKSILGVITLLLATVTFAEEKIKMNFKNQGIDQVLEQYSKAANQKIIFDSTVRGQINILNPSEVSIEEAFNQLSEALALNGFAVVKQGDTFTIKNARSAQRDNLQVSEELPAAKPQRLATWVINLKNISAQDVIKELRLLTSSYGELSTNTHNNQLIITDWTSNLQRVAEVLKRVDRPMDPSVAKIVAQAKKEQRDRKDSKSAKAKDKEKESEAKK